MFSLRLAASALAAAMTLSGTAQATHHAALHHPTRPQRGLASYYRPTAGGKLTASGKRAHPGRLTAASKSLPLGSRARVTNVQTGKKVVVTVTDRGPFKKGRIVDVSPKAAERLGMKDAGVAPVKVQPLALPAKK